MTKIAAMVGTPDLSQDTLAVYCGDLGRAFSRLASLGYDGVELMARDPLLLNGAAIRRMLEENNLQLVGLCTGHVYAEDGLGLVGPDAEVCMRAMTRLKAFVDFAAAHFEAGILVNIGRSRGPGIPNEPMATLGEMTSAFRELAEYAAPRGVKLVLEPINALQSSSIHTTQEGIGMVGRVNHPNFGLMLDVYHMNIEDVDIYASFREAGQMCWLVHLADNNRRWPGSAHLDFTRITNAMQEIGYKGFASLEILPWPDPDTAARSAIGFLRRFFPRE